MARRAASEHSLSLNTSPLDTNNNNNNNNNAENVDNRLPVANHDANKLTSGGKDDEDNTTKSRRRHKLQKMLGNEVMLAADHASATPTSNAIADIVSNVVGAARVDWSSPFREFRFVDDLLEVEAAGLGVTDRSVVTEKLRAARCYLFNDLLLHCGVGKNGVLTLRNAIALDLGVLVNDIDATTFQVLIMRGITDSLKLTLRAVASPIKQRWLDALAHTRSSHDAALVAYKASVSAAAQPHSKAARRLGLSRDDALLQVAPDTPPLPPPVQVSPNAVSSATGHSSGSTLAARLQTPLHSVFSRKSQRRELKPPALVDATQVRSLYANTVPTESRSCAHCGCWLSGNIVTVSGMYTYKK